MTGPIPVRVLRHRCPHCTKTYNRPGRTREHMGRCWNNPEARGCKTCQHFVEGHDACGCEPGCNWGNAGQPVHEGCAVGVNLSGRPACGNCQGEGETFDRGSLGVSECPECGGDGAEVKPGPIVHCEKWEAIW